MLIKGIGKTIIASFILASGMAAAAHVTDVPCPSASAVKGASTALNGVIRQSEKSYFVLSAQPAINESDLGWVIMTQTQGNSFDPAFTNGQTDVKSVIAAVSSTAMEMQGLYVCPYMTSSGGMNVLAAAPVDQGTIVNPLALKWDAIKLTK